MGAIASAVGCRIPALFRCSGTDGLLAVRDEPDGLFGQRVEAQRRLAERRRGLVRGIEHSRTWIWIAHRTSVLFTARDAVFWPLIYQCSSITVPLCASRAITAGPSSLCLSTVPRPILTGHYACNCIPDDISRCPVSVMPMIPIVFFNRRYARFLVNFKPDLQLSIGLLGSNPKIFRIIALRQYEGRRGAGILRRRDIEDIATALSKVRWFFVIARNSSFIYKGRPVDVKQVGRELGVHLVRNFLAA